MLAVGLGQLLQLNPVAGDQVYVTAPDTFNATLFPSVIVCCAGVIFITLMVVVFTESTAVAVQPLLSFTVTE